MNRYYPGQGVTITNGATPTAANAAPFKDLSGAPIDPSVVTITIYKPDQSSVAPTVTHDGTGLYHSNLVVDQAGFWNYKIAGSGTVAAVAWGVFEVLAPPFS